MQFVDLEMPLSHDFHLYCPVTGQAIALPGEEVTPSPATKFIYCLDVSEFIHVDDAMQQVYDAAEEELDDESETHPYDSFLATLRADPAQRNLTVLTITKRGFACGPVSETFAVGIDMAYVHPEDDE